MLSRIFKKVSLHALPPALGAGSFTMMLGFGAAFNSIASLAGALLVGLGGGAAAAIPISLGVYFATDRAIQRFAQESLTDKGVADSSSNSNTFTL